jgi:polyisoprenyl-phosphate glycosyltransferase
MEEKGLQAPAFSPGSTPSADPPENTLPSRKGRVGEEGSPSIPTSDPEAALRFCQSLARFLTSTSLCPDTGGIPSPGGVALSGQGTLSGPEVSVVIPIFNEEGNIPALYSRLAGALKGTGMDHEIIFVDDGSGDESLKRLYSIRDEDPQVTIVELSRNFGHQVAISAGLDHARGKAVLVMDADLQDPPEVLPQFIKKWQEGHDVVYAIRKNRKEGWGKRLAYAAFYRLLHRTANIDIPLDAGDFCIMDRRVVNLLMAMPERNRFVRGIRSWVGLDQVGLAYERQARQVGRSRYTFLRLVYLALDGLISFSYLPLRVIAILGALISFFSLLMAIFYAGERLLVGLNPPGFATLTVAIFFFAGVQLITMGVIGEYVGRIFEEVKRRPLYVVRRVTRRPSPCAS